MLQKYQRLCNHKDFAQVFKKGKRHSFGGVLLSYKPNNLTYTRIGFIVSKKYSLSAVNRNQQRRILQSAMQKIYPVILPGFDIVVTYTKHDKMLPYKDTLSLLSKIFKKINIIK